ncbi:unnamed protein product [Orchesella dallaii]|uniref:CCHC-type domain-containing protein n=1 Tax=Orchesella dallaii TaxID=48710 RepID=A0ABP1QFM7_9HEXA
MPKSDPTTPTNSKGLRSGKPYQNVIDHLVTIRRRKAKNTRIPSPIPQGRINTPQNTEAQIQATPSTSKRQYAEVLKTPTTSGDDALVESKSRIDALIAQAHAAIQRGRNPIPTSSIGDQTDPSRITPLFSINPRNPELDQVINVGNSENSGNLDTSTSENTPTNTMDIDEVTALINQRVAEAIQANNVEHEATQREKDTELDRLRIDNDVLLQKLQNPSPNRALTSALSGLGIVAANAITAEKPKFKEGRTPPEEFLRDVEGFLTSHGYKEEHFITLVKTLLPEDLRRWYDYVVPLCKDWPAFRAQFKSRYGGFLEFEKRVTELQTRFQKYNEPTEKFIYDMVQLSKYCYEMDRLEANHVQRAQSKLLPELQLAIGTTPFASVLALVYACDVATRTLEAKDKLAKRPFTIPPLRASSREGYSSKDKSSHDGNQANGRGNNLRFHFQARFRGGSRRGEPDRGGRGRGQIPRGGYQSYSNNYRGPPTMRGYPTRGRGEHRGAENRGSYNPERNYRGNSRAMSNRGRGVRGISRTTDYQRGRTYPGNTNPPAPRRIIECHRCHGFGHVQSACPNQIGIAMVVGTDGAQYPRFEDWEEYPEDQMQDYPEDQREDYPENQREQQMQEGAGGSQGHNPTGNNHNNLN